jgi:hypothetical protein
VFENRAPRRIVGRKREKVAGGWRRLLNEELHNLYSSADVIKVMKSRRMSWPGHVARMGDMRSAYTVLVGKPKEIDNSGGLGVDGSIILEGIYMLAVVTCSFDNNRGGELLCRYLKKPV